MARVVDGSRLPDYLGPYRHLYPRIVPWAEKVANEVGVIVPNDDRAAFWVIHEGVEAGLVVIKRKASEHFKVCHFSVLPWARGRGFGTLLLNRAVTWMCGDLEGLDATVIQRGTMYMTMARETFAEHHWWFSDRGFGLQMALPGMYRPGVEELLFTARLAEVWAILGQRSASNRVSQTL